MMLAEVSALLAHLPADAARAAYREAVVDQNLLAKPTRRSREFALRSLIQLYGLDPAFPLFRVFRMLWGQDEAAQPVLALTISLARDPILRSSRDLVVAKRCGESVGADEIKAVLAAADPDRLSAASLASYARNIRSTWTQAGFLKGSTRKLRTAPRVMPTNIALWLFLGHLEGLSGKRLFTSRWAALAGSTPDQLQDLAAAAANRGMIVLRSAGGVVEVRFPGYLTAEEEKWLCE
jgi:hypothetical protein